MKTILFAPEAINLSEVTRMIEFARASRGQFNILFATYGGEFELLIDEAGFTVELLAPRLSKEGMEHLNMVSKGEKLARAFTDDEIRQRVQSELTFYKKNNVDGIVTGFCVTIPVSARIAGIPFVWSLQSTCLAESFLNGKCGPHGSPLWFRRLFGWFVYRLIIFHSNTSFINQANRLLREKNCEPFKNVFDFWQGSATILGEPPEFSNLPRVPPNHYFLGPVTVKINRPVPPEISALTCERPIVYLAMGSTATIPIIKKTITELGKTDYIVIAPVKWYLRNDSFTIPKNVIVTELLPAHVVNKLADISVIHGGNGTVMNALMAGKPIVGVGMQFEQMANLECIVERGFCIRISKYRFSAKKLVRAIDTLLTDKVALRKAQEFKKIIDRDNGAENGARVLKSVFDF